MISIVGSADAHPSRYLNIEAENIVGVAMQEKSDGKRQRSDIGSHKIQ